MKDKRGINRRLSREVAMELFFSGNLNDLDEDSISNYLILMDEDGSLDEMERASIDEDYINLVIKSFMENKRLIEEKISANLDKSWSLNRISKVHKSILSLALAEQLANIGIDPGISINEALELTRKYSEEEGVKFINSVLDKAIKSLNKSKEE